MNKGSETVLKNCAKCLMCKLRLSTGTAFVPIVYIYYIREAK